MSDHIIKYHTLIPYKLNKSDIHWVKRLIITIIPNVSACKIIIIYLIQNIYWVYLCETWTVGSNICSESVCQIQF